jgi:hypothetical protein
MTCELSKLVKIRGDMQQLMFFSFLSLSGKIKSVAGMFQSGLYVSPQVRMIKINNFLNFNPVKNFLIPIPAFIPGLNPEQIQLYSKIPFKKTLY